MMVVSLQVWLPLGCLEEERTALLQLKDSLNYPNGTSLPSWRKGDACCCDWESVRCNSSTGRVTKLQLYAVRNGELGDWFLNASLFLPFQELNYLDLSDNQIAGWVENKGLCDLNHLRVLYINSNDLSGFLPPCQANLTSLRELDLSSNHLKISMSLSPLYNLSELKYFDGSDNEIYAEEDDHNLSPKFQLEYLYLSGHGQDAGAFPKFLYHQFNLQTLDLSNIQIKGEFPSWLIENNTYLKGLYLENCSLSGPFLLPRSSHVNLSLLSISMNYFQGQIPAEIRAYFPRLGVLIMSGNGFDGSIPSSLGSMSSLDILDLSDNGFDGNIPSSLGSMSYLQMLDLSGNGFDGNIPSSLGSMSSLQMLDLSNNNLMGRMFSNNSLQGHIPGWIGNIKQGPDEEVTSLITSWENQVYSPESSTRAKVTEFARCLNKKWSRQISAAKKAIEDLWKLAFSYQVNHLAAVQPLPSTTRGDPDHKLSAPGIKGRP
ncbi:hypothetical protein DKX38_028734 [Salix brachista]|uniref:Leucine-rich repeat-containing N-terminal plant-type domain-containing protein n=1 Tax=Salix brachista TaxID=2182728 RepID=A0A5N5J6B7_9ROSI|nr:hypothetical protein DKX38_028734 [Salix brachista]